MNIRGNIVVQERFGGKVYLYTHKRGLETFGILHNALVRSVDRWRDEQYLTRIIFCELLKGEDLDGTADFGISTFVGENDLPMFVVDSINCRVLMEEGRCLSTCPCVGYVWTFEEFLKLTEDPRIGLLQMRAQKEGKEE
jgi:hypothetical protein